MKISKYYFKVLENKRVIFLTDNLHDDLIYKTKETNDKGEVTNFTLNKDVKPLTDEKYAELINAKDAIFYENNDFVVKVKPEMPSQKHLKYAFNENTWQWEVVTTKEELVALRRNRITQVQQIKRDLQDLIDFGDSELEIAQLEEQKAILMQEIQELAELIKAM